MKVRGKLLTFLILLSFCIAISSSLHLSQPTVEGLKFNVSKRNIERGDAFRVYAKWNETVNSSLISFGISSIDPEENYTCVPNLTCNETWNSSWTNYTIWTNKSWELGRHRVRIYVNSTWESGRVSNFTEGNFILWDVTFNRTLGREIGVGRIESHAESYHYYFINTSSLENLTCLSFTLNVSPTLLNSFLLDESGKLKGREMGVGDENFSCELTPGKVWELRIYGNSSDPIPFYLRIDYFTINTTKPQVDLGEKNLTQSEEILVEVKNEGEIEGKCWNKSEIYKLIEFKDVGEKSFQFFLPQFIEKVGISLEWDGGNDYEMVVITPWQESWNSTEEFLNYLENAEIANVSKKIYANFTDVKDGGRWVVEVRNQTQAANYTLRIKAWLNEEEWISSNLSRVWYYRKFGEENSTATFNFTITVPRRSLSGLHEGYLLFCGIPMVKVKLNVTTPELVVNHTYQKAEVRVAENLGVARKYTLEVPINNSGNVELKLWSTNSTFLNNSRYPSSYIKFNYSHPEAIPPNSWGILAIHIYINTSTTSNKPGNYLGCIYLNSTAAT